MPISKIKDTIYKFMISSSFNDIQKYGTDKSLFPYFEQSSTTMYNACLSGNLELLYYILLQSSFSFNINECMRLSAKGGHLEILELFIHQGANDYVGAIEYASSSGNIYIAEILYKQFDEINQSFIFKKEKYRYTNEWFYNICMANASKNGYYNCVIYCIEKGATNFSSGLINAIRCENLKLVSLFIEKKAIDINWALEEACILENEQIVYLLLDSYSNIDLNSGFKTACFYKRIEIVKILLEELEKYYKEEIENIHFGKFIEIVRKNGGKEIEKMLEGYLKK